MSLAKLLAFLNNHPAVAESFIDLDSDGYVGVQDCDPRNPLVHPDAVEIDDDQVDSDCNGSDDFIGDNLITWFNTSRGRAVADLTENRTFFGSWALMPAVNTTAHVLGWAFQFTGSDNPSGGLFSIVPTQAVAADYWAWCVLADDDGGAVVMGPVSPDEDGKVFFTDDFWMDPTGMTLNFECEPTGLYPNSPLAFAVNLDLSVPPSETLIAEDNATGDRLAIDVRALNGSSFSPDFSVEIQP